MNHPVQDQDPQFRGQSVRAPPRISPRGLGCDDNISDIMIRPGRPRPQERTRPASSRSVSRKREHVSWPLFVSKFSIHPRNGRIAYETDCDTFVRETQFVLHAFAEAGQRAYSQWYAALPI